MSTPLHCVTYTTNFPPLPKVLSDDAWVRVWQSYPDYCWMMVLFHGEDAVCYAFLHKLDFDPLGKFKKPHSLNYLYTPAEFRGRGYATRVLRELKDLDVVLCALEDTSIYQNAGYAHTIEDFSAMGGSVLTETFRSH